MNFKIFLSLSFYIHLVNLIILSFSIYFITTRFSYIESIPYEHKVWVALFFSIHYIIHSICNAAYLLFRC